MEKRQRGGQTLHFKQSYCVAEGFEHKCECVCVPVLLSLCEPVWARNLGSKDVSGKWKWFHTKWIFSSPLQYRDALWWSTENVKVTFKKKECSVNNESIQLDIIKCFFYTQVNPVIFLVFFPPMYGAIGGAFVQCLKLIDWKQLSYSVKTWPRGAPIHWSIDGSTFWIF